MWVVFMLKRTSAEMCTPRNLKMTRSNSSPLTLWPECGVVLGWGRSPLSSWGWDVRFAKMWTSLSMSRTTVASPTNSVRMLELWVAIQRMMRMMRNPGSKGRMWTPPTTTTWWWGLLIRKSCSPTSWLDDKNSCRSLRCVKWVEEDELQTLILIHVLLEWPSPPPQTTAWGRTSSYLAFVGLFHTPLPSTSQI